MLFLIIQPQKCARCSNVWRSCGQRLARGSECFCNISDLQHKCFVQERIPSDFSTFQTYLNGAHAPHICSKHFLSIFRTWANETLGVPLHHYWIILALAWFAVICNAYPHQNTL